VQDQLLGPRRLSRLVLASLLAASPFVGAPAAFASFIAMETTAETQLDGERLRVRVTSTNRGDEPAFQVKLEALLPGDSKSSPILERVEVGASAEHTFEWPAPVGEYRQRVIPIVTHYTDANYYAFSAVARSVVTFGDPPVTAFTGRIDNVEADPKANLQLHLRSVDGSAHALDVRMAMPAELGVEPASSSVQLPASGEVVADFALENYSGLPGSSYTVWAIVSEATPGGVVEREVAGSVRIVEPVPAETPRVWIAALLAGLALVFVAWQLGVFRRLRGR
jgi:hypothetical protein